MKYYEQQNIGKAKYVVNYHTVKTHKDGSEFYEIRIFSNRRAKDRFVTSLMVREVQQVYDAVYADALTVGPHNPTGSPERAEQLTRAYMSGYLRTH